MEPMTFPVRRRTIDADGPIHFADFGCAGPPMVLVHGLGGALLEELIYDDDGQLLTSTFMDYVLPSAAECPTIEVLILEEGGVTSNPLGVKGAGEGGTLPAPAAIANAIADALRPLGVIVTEMPLTRARLWRCLRAARERG